MSDETKKEVESLGEALPKMMAHVRDKVMPPYIQIGPSGAFALMFMRKALDDAARAMAEGDVVAMLRAYEELKDFTSDPLPRVLNTGDDDDRIPIWCPWCSKRHIDEGEFETRRHHTHRCVDDSAGKGCGREWRFEEYVFGAA